MKSFFAIIEAEGGEKMEWISAMQRAIAYIEAHLTEEINYEDVAAHIHTSSYEFHKTFSFLTGMTANAYIRNRRLSLAGREVLETDRKITDIAFEYGYETPESFSKAFTRFHGVSPRMAREEGAKLVLFNPLAIRITLEGGKSMDYRMVQEKEKKFLVISKDFRNEIINEEGNHEVPDFWGECLEKKVLEPLLSLRPAGKKDLYGVCSPAKPGSDTFEYAIGILIDANTASFDEAEMKEAGYILLDVKPNTYAVFDCIGEDAGCVGETWEKFYKEFLPQMGYEAENAEDFEIYPEKEREGVFCELWIPVRKK